MSSVIGIGVGTSFSERLAGGSINVPEPPERTIPFGTFAFSESGQDSYFTFTSRTGTPGAYFSGIGASA